LNTIIKSTPTYKKYLNFTVILIVLSVFDIITTQYALSTYPHLSEGNPIMSLVTSSFAGFVLVKAFGIMLIVNLYRRIQTHNETASKIGKSAIILIMLFVVGNNIIQIASATTSYGFPNPHELESPAWVNLDGSVDQAFIGHNNYNVTTYFNYNVTANGGLDYAAQNRFYSNNMVRYAVVDGAHPQRLFLVFSNLDVAYTDSIGGVVTYENGYYADNVWPLTGCSNCNDLHKIGVLTSIGTQMGGFVDSNGDLILTQGLSIVKFVRSADYSKTTMFTISAPTYFTASTASPGPTVSDYIGSVRVDSSGNYHLFQVGSSSSHYGGGCPNSATARSNHIVVSATGTLIYKELIGTYITSTCSDTSATVPGNILIQSNTTNTTHNIVVGYALGTAIHLESENTSGHTDICPTSCGTITGFNGLQIYDGYAYIASAAENKIYRFPTTITVSSGNGYIPGAGVGATTGEIIYTSKTIESRDTSYYNHSAILLDYNINMDTGITSGQFTLLPLNYNWVINLVDPNGVVVNHYQTGKCAVDFFTCHIMGSLSYTAPSIGWWAGAWTAKLYEVNTITGHTTLITVSTPFTVIGNSSDTIAPPTEPITSGTAPDAIIAIDWWVTLLGLGLNVVSKMAFSLVLITLIGLVVLLVSKRGDVAALAMFAPYAFFTYINYIPKWIFIIVIIMLAIISRVFR